MRAQRAGEVGGRHGRNLSAERHLTLPVASAAGPLPLPAPRGTSLATVPHTAIAVRIVGGPEPAAAVDDAFLAIPVVMAHPVREIVGGAGLVAALGREIQADICAQQFF